MAITGYAHQNTTTAGVPATERVRTTEEVLGEAVSALHAALRRLAEMDSNPAPAQAESPPPVGIIATAIHLHALSASLDGDLMRLQERLGRL